MLQIVIAVFSLYGFQAEIILPKQYPGLDNACGEVVERLEQTLRPKPGYFYKVGCRLIFKA